jgi:myo-inositol 2-dehydrogenase / D-chiro-inositol 1-dehydrogenase
MTASWARKKLEPEGIEIFSDFYEMINTPGLAAVIVASLTELHVEHTLAAVKRGIYIL